MRTTILESGPDLVHVAWAGSWTRDAGRDAVQRCHALMQAHGASRLLLDLNGLVSLDAPPPDKYFLGCLLVAHLTDARCAVLLPKEYITGLLARVGAEAGMALRTFWSEASAREWLAPLRQPAAA